MGNIPNRRGWWWWRLSPLDIWRVVWVDSYPSDPKLCIYGCMAHQTIVDAAVPLTSFGGEWGPRCVPPGEVSND